jgi:hypothetical protein
MGMEDGQLRCLCKSAKVRMGEAYEGTWGILKRGSGTRESGVQSTEDGVEDSTWCCPYLEAEGFEENKA